MKTRFSHTEILLLLIIITSAGLVGQNRARTSQVVTFGIITSQTATLEAPSVSAGAPQTGEGSSVAVHSALVIQSSSPRTKKITAGLSVHRGTGETVDLLTDDGRVRASQTLTTISKEIFSLNLPSTQQQQRINVQYFTPARAYPTSGLDHVIYTITE